jgi:hypothetical protein
MILLLFGFSNAANDSSEGLREAVSASQERSRESF